MRGLNCRNEIPNTVNKGKESHENEQESCNRIYYRIDQIKQLRNSILITIPTLLAHIGTIQYSVFYVNGLLIIV